jgi:hypothetical protein
LDGEARTAEFIEVESVPFEHGHYFDSEALRGAIAASPGADTAGHRVMIRYVPGDPGRLTLEDDRFRPVSRGFPFFSVLWFGFGPVWLVMVLLLVLAYMIARAVISVLAPAPGR